MSREQMKARLAAATPGPWEPMRSGLYGMRVVHVDGEWDEGIIPNEFITIVVPALRNHQDAEFIANAPTDLAKLHAALDAVEAVISAADLESDEALQEHLAESILAAIRNALGEDQ